MKPHRGKLNNWQVHHLDFHMDEVIKLYPQMKGVKELIIVTGSITGDKSEKYNDFDHYRSSLVLTLDRKGGMVETLNSILDLGEEGNDVVCNPITGESDMGNEVLDLFY